MPRKIRDLMRDLADAGFILMKGAGKGDHQVFRHPNFPIAKVVLDGRPGEDAKPYQERHIRLEIAKTLGDQE